MTAHSHDPRGVLTRNGAARFAAKLAEEAAERELLEALHESIHSTGLADHSAAQELSDEFDVDLSTVYRWPLGELACGPVAKFFRFVDAVIRAKGPHNQAAYALPRLVRRRYLDPRPEQREATPALVVAGAAGTMEAVGGLLSSLLKAVGPESDGGCGLTRAELTALEPEFERVAELFESLRLAIPSCVRRVPLHAEGRPS